ncbi:MAG: rRNA maturation RNase YbeY [Alphaproteobacteria bacterium]|nr:MAG: rRNA maturation RNase YbeY [Alphaproteobacteria bacterium]
MSAQPAAPAPGAAEEEAILAPPVEIVIEAPGWRRTPLAEVAPRAARATLETLGLAPDLYEVVILACDDERIRGLNESFRGRAVPTNVLSWPAEDLAPDRPGGVPARPAAGQPGAPAHLGDIALALGVCTREAEEQGKALGDHLAHLVVHGVLHLLGYDHESDADAERMEDLERRILARLGVDDPYAVR